MKSNLESNWIWTLQFLYLIIHFVQKLDGTRDAKLGIQLKSNWIFFDLWLLIYIYIYIYIYMGAILRTLNIKKNEFELVLALMAHLVHCNNYS